MRKITVDPKRRMQEILPRKNEDVLLVQDGHPVALVVPFDDNDLDWYVRERDPEFIESIRQARRQAAKGETITHEEFWAKSDRPDEKELQDDLMDSRGAIEVSEAAELAPDSAGLYTVFIDDALSLREPFSSCIERSGSKLIYVGVATISIRKRLIEGDFKSQQASTFFRSLGAVLGFTPSAGALAARQGKRNFAFAPADKRSIRNWIESHVRTKWMESRLPTNDLLKMEARLIREHAPLFNLAGNSQAMPELPAIRRKCRTLAKGE